MKNRLLTIDSTLCTTELCQLGTVYPTDKSPYNIDPTLHKHAYTSIYSLLFATLRNKYINLAEIGIYHNMSIQCWRKFFPYANIYGLEFNQDFINSAISHKLEKVYYSLIDVTNEHSIKTAFDLLNCKMDIIIDDSTHDPHDQISIISTCINYLNSGGYLVIEDLFKRFDIGIFNDILKKMSPLIEDYFFIDANHDKKHSEHWNNDRLLIIVRK